MFTPILMSLLLQVDILNNSTIFGVCMTSMIFGLLIAQV